MHPTSPLGKKDPTAGDLCNPLRASGTTKPGLLSSAMEGRLKAKGFVAVEGMGAGSIGTVLGALGLVNKRMWGQGKIVRATVESMSTVARDGAREHPGLRLIMKLEDLPEGVTGQAACGHRVVRKLKSCSHVAKVAGSISKIIRASLTPVGLVLTDDSPTTVNTAVKSIALTRTMLKHDMVDVSFTAYPVGSTVQLTVLPLADSSLISAEEFLFLPLEKYEKASNVSQPSSSSSQAGEEEDNNSVGSRQLEKTSYTHDPYTWGEGITFA